MFILAIPSLSLANKVANTGELISANIMNSSISQLGEIKQSLLSVAKFQQINGSCWVRMQGQTIAGSDLAVLEPSLSTLPDTVTEGTFLRQAKSGRELGSYEADEFKSHNHNITQRIASSTSAGTDFESGRSNGTVDNSETTHMRGGEETRPKNTAVNFFIKINKNCAFN